MYSPIPGVAMARDPYITVRERLVKAARRLAAIDRDVDILDPAQEAEIFRRVDDMTDAVRAYEKFQGMRPLKFCLPRTTRTRTTSATTKDSEKGERNG